MKMIDLVSSGISCVAPSGSATTVLFVGLVEQSTVAQTCSCDLANLISSLLHAHECRKQASFMWSFAEFQRWDITAASTWCQRLLRKIQRTARYQSSICIMGLRKIFRCVRKVSIQIESQNGWLSNYRSESLLLGPTCLVSITKLPDSALYCQVWTALLTWLSFTIHSCAHAHTHTNTMWYRG